MPKKVTDEQIVDALIKCGSQRKAAAELEISTQTLSKRLQGEKLRNKYEDAKTALLTNAVDGMKRSAPLAINTLIDVMKDKNNPATVRVSAADSMLRHLVRYVETVEMERRITALERGTENDESGEQAESS